MRESKNVFQRVGHGDGNWRPLRVKKKIFLKWYFQRKVKKLPRKESQISADFVTRPHLSKSPVHFINLSNLERKSNEQDLSTVSTSAFAKRFKVWLAHQMCAGSQIPVNKAIRKMLGKCCTNSSLLEE